MTMALSRCSIPEMVLNTPGFSRDPCSFCDRTLANTSLMSDDFPLPETPVTEMNFPSGNEASTPVRLFCVTPVILRNFPVWSGILEASRRINSLAASAMVSRSMRLRPLR
jgi:hypothetical protein